MVAATGVITTVAGNGIQGASGDGGDAASAGLAGPGAIALDQANNIFFVDGGDQIRKIDFATNVIDTVAGTGASNGYSGQGDGGPASSAFLFALSISIDGNGSLYISDRFRIRKIDANSGIITTVAGNGVDGFAGDYLPATHAQISQNARATVDLAGNIFIADYGNNRVRKVDAASGMITTIAGTGTAGFMGDHGMANVSQLYYPIAVAVDLSGNLYIDDYVNQRIRMVNAWNFP